MTETVVAKTPVTDAVIARLEAALNFAVGDNQAPPEPRTPEFPYCVVYSLDDEERSGPQSDGQADVTHNIQVTTVGQTRGQAQRLSDLVHAAMRATVGATNVYELAIAGRLVQLVEEVEGGGVIPDNESQPPLFYGITIYAIMTTPA